MRCNRPRTAPRPSAARGRAAGRDRARPWSAGRRGRRWSAASPGRAPRRRRRVAARPRPRALRSRTRPRSSPQRTGPRRAPYGHGRTARLRLPMAQTDVLSGPDPAAEHDSGPAPQLSVVVTRAQRGGDARGAPPPHDRHARRPRPAVRADLRRRRLDRRHVRDARAAPRRRPARPRRPLQAQLRPAPGDARRPRARARRDRRDDGRRPAEPARGHPEARRGGRGRLRRRQRPPRRAPRLVGPDAAVAA